MGKRINTNDTFSGGRVYGSKTQRGFALRKMKSLWGILVFILTVTSLSACGKENDLEENITYREQDGIIEPSEDINLSSKEPETAGIESEPVQSEAANPSNISLPEESSSVRSDSVQRNSENAGSMQSFRNEADLYEGKYNDYDTDDIALEIRKGDDGNYTIFITIFRLAYMDDGVGTVTDGGIAFSATAPNGKSINGRITLEDDIATVTFLSEEWEEFSNVNEYKFRKTSG